MTVIEDNNIYVSRGDSINLDLYFEGGSVNGACAIVSLKESVEDTCPLWEKRYTIGSDNYFRAFITSQDTDYPFGDYVWDVRLKYPDTAVETPMGVGKFTIKETVGNV